MLTQQVGDAFVAIFPTRREPKRTARRAQCTEHDIDIVVTGRLDTDSTVAIIERWEALFLDGGGPLEHACMETTMLDGSEAGYNLEALTQTPSMFFGGLRLTFWELHSQQP